MLGKLAVSYKQLLAAVGGGLASGHAEVCRAIELLCESAASDVS